MWVLDHGHPIQDPVASPATAILRAYDASNITQLLYSSAQNAADAPGFGIKFTEPIVANGKVFIATAHDLERCFAARRVGRLRIKALNESNTPGPVATRARFF